MITKYDQGLCKWPKCNRSSVGGRPTIYENDEWILPLYCEEHGKKALSNRKKKIACE